MEAKGRSNNRGAIWRLILALLHFSCTGALEPAVNDDSSITPAGQAAVPTDEATPEPVPKVSSPFDLGSVMRRVHFAFRPAPQGLRGGHATYSVLVRKSGQISVTPIRYGDSANLPRHNKATAVRAAAATFETIDITRGDLSLSRPPSAQRTADGQVRIGGADSHVAEFVHNHADGIEQSWHFAQAPSGSGALTVRIRVSGQAYRGKTAHGLHFVDEQTGVGLRYSLASWIDARGQRTTLRPHFKGDEIRITVPERLLKRSPFPAVLDPTISAEFGMDNPVYAPAVEMQQYPAIASNGSEFMVVWQDNRGTDWDIFGTRVRAADGAILDSSGIAIATATDDQQRPAIAYDATSGDYLVAWQDNRGASWDIYGTRLSSTGTVRDGSGTAYSTATGDQQQPTVATDGTQFLVAWQDKRSGAWDIYGARVNAADGTRKDLNGFAISPADQDQTEPAAAYDGSTFLVVWTDKRTKTDTDIYGARVTSAGGLQDASGLSIGAFTNDQNAPSLAFDGTNYLVAWADNRNSATTKWDIYGARVVPASGAVVGADAFGVPITNADKEQQYPAVVYDGTNFVVAWADFRDGQDSPVKINWNVYGTRVRPSDAFVLDAGGIAISNESTNDQQYPAIAHDGSSTTLVGWADFRSTSGGTDWDIYGVRINSSGGFVGSTIAISTGPNEQQHSAVAFDGANYLVVWADFRNGGKVGMSWDIVGTRVNDDGDIVDTSGIVISSDTSEQIHPDVTYGGGSYLVVWEDLRNGPKPSTEYDIYAARVATDGAVSDPAGFPISQADEDQQYPRAAYDGVNYLVVWQDKRTTGSKTDIYGARVSTAGTVLASDTAGIPISTAAEDQQLPDVAFVGGNYLVIWQDKRFGSNWDIYGSRIDPNGSITTSVLDPAGRPISITSNDQQQPRLAHDGAQFLAVWQDKRSGSNLDIYGARVTTAGAVLEAPNGIAICTNPSDQETPSTTFVGNHFLVAWADSRAVGSKDIYGARVRTDGTVRDSPTVGLVLSDGSTDELAPALATDRLGSALLSYYQVDPDSSLATDRVRVRFVRAFDNGEDCSDLVDCKSSFCIDGVCCDTACGNGANDCQACSTTAGATADGTCAPVPAGTKVCRGQDGQCDVVEMCDGVNATCPADGFAPATTECRAKDGACDLAENCTGSSRTCPADAVADSDTVCRVIAGDCDVAESCTGSSKACPTDAFKSDATECRAQNGDCDVAENCSGTAATCPTDAVRETSYTCREKDGDCDVTENCDGIAKTCPADAVAAPGTQCRGATGLCDVVETCDGSAKTCPADVLAASGVTCRAQVGECDVAEVCNGIAVGCPVDVFVADGTECASGSCQSGTCVSPQPDAGPSADSSIDDGATTSRDAGSVGDAAASVDVALADSATGTDTATADSRQQADLRVVDLDDAVTQPDAREGDALATVADVSTSGDVGSVPTSAKGGCDCDVRGDGSRALRGIPLALVIFGLFWVRRRRLRC